MTPIIALPPQVSPKHGTAYMNHEYCTAILSAGGQCIITADHGNAEQMIDEENGGPFTAHTTNPVPCILVGERYQNAALRSGGKLCDLAPTLLDMMELPVPEQMTGTSLIQKR